MPRRKPLSLYLRTGASALLLAAARLSGDSARTVWAGRFGSRVLDGETLRAVLYSFLCAPRSHVGPDAQPAAGSVDALLPSGNAGWTGAAPRRRSGADHNLFAPCRRQTARRGAENCGQRSHETIWR